MIDEKIGVEEAASKALKEGETLAELLEGIVSKQDKIRFNGYHVLLHISEHNPDILYPKWDYLADLLTSDNHYNRYICLLYTSDAADDLLCVDLGGRRIIKKK